MALRDEAENEDELEQEERGQPVQPNPYRVQRIDAGAMVAIAVGARYQTFAIANMPGLTSGHVTIGSQTHTHTQSHMDNMTKRIAFGWSLQLSYSYS